MSLITSLLGGTGDVTTNAANTFTIGPQTIQTGAAGNKGLIVKAAANQTAPIVELQDSTGALLSRFGLTGGTTGPLHAEMYNTATGVISLFQQTATVSVLATNTYYDGTSFKRVASKGPATMIQILDNAKAWSFNVSVDAGTTADSIIGYDEAARISSSSVSISRDLIISDTRNIVVGSTTGTQIGTATTQKLGFFAATPVVQPATVAAAPAGGVGTAAGGWDTAANRDAAITTINGLRTALRSLGLMA